MSFTDKVVLVTGASSGIGASTAILFAKEGANVAIVGRNEEKLKNILKHCERYGKNKYLLIKADITKTENAIDLVQRTVKEFGKLDVLVNNAGIVKFAGIFSSNLMEAYDETMNTNLRAQVHITNLAVPYLVKTKGSIVNISSIASVTVQKNFKALAYYVSKAGLNHFTRAIALELAEHGVRANSISPGLVRTDFFENANIDDPCDKFCENTALNRVSQADEIGELVLYLASDKARGITGADYVCDNGFLIKN